MWPDRVSNPRPLSYESGALPTALRGPAKTKNQLMQLCTARTAWSDSVIRSDSVIKLVFGKCTTHRGYEMLTNGNQTTVW